MLKKSILILLVLITAALTGCDEESPLYPIFHQPDVEVKNVLKLQYDNAPPELQVFVRNKGNADAYSVRINVKAKRGNTIIASGGCGIASGSWLSEDETGVNNILFPGLASHSDYDFLEVYVEWYDYDYNHFDEVFFF